MCDANNNKKIDGPDAQDEPKTFVTDVYAIGVTLWARLISIYYKAIINLIVVEALMKQPNLVHFSKILDDGIIQNSSIGIDKIYYQCLAGAFNKQNNEMSSINVSIFACGRCGAPGSGRSTSAGRRSGTCPR